MGGASSNNGNSSAEGECFVDISSRELLRATTGSRSDLDSSP